MYAKSPNSSLQTFILVAYLATLFLSVPYFAFAQQCINNTIFNADGSQGRACAPATCPGSGSSCMTCSGGTIQNSNNPSVTNGTPCDVPPAPSSNSALARDGIFGCSASKYQNIGSTVAVGGVYVPVNDAAVTINTGYLVYKECVLDGVVSAIKNDTVAELQRQAIQAANTGRNGRPRYIQNLTRDLAPRAIAIVVNGLQDSNLSPMCEAFRQDVRRAYARGQYWDERVQMMQHWSDYLDQLRDGGDVIEIDFRKITRARQ